MRTVRILSLDGGGIRGIFSATFLERFCIDAGIEGNKIWEYFDIIIGTSIGGIQALSYSNGLSPTDVINLLKEKGPLIFNDGPASAARLGYILLTPFVDCYLYYTEPLRDALIGVLGDTKMFQLKTNTFVTSVGFTGGTTDSLINYPYGNITGIEYNHFSNVLIPGITVGQNYSCVDVAIATGSAPVYFHPTQISNADVNNWYIDGGLYQNNPTALGYAFSNVLFPNQVRTCILSVGTGYSIPDIKIDTSIDSSDGGLKLAPTSSLELLSTSLNMTLLGAQTAVSKQFEIMSLYNGANNNISYYRFQSYLADQNLNQLDNPSTEAIKYLQDSANAQYDIDFLKIQSFIQHAQAVN